MLTTSLVLGLILSIGNGQKLIQIEDNCICVSIEECNGYNDNENLIDVRTNLDLNIECGSALKTCCNKTNIISKNYENNPTKPEATDSTEQGENCICVPFVQCKGFNEGKNVFNLRQNTDTDRECDSTLKTCCHRDDVILENPDDSSTTATDVDITESTTNATLLECGYTNRQKNITRTSSRNIYLPDEFPWMVQIFITKTKVRNFPRKRVQHHDHYLSGGSLIHPSVVLTLARTVYNKPKTQLKIRAGSENGYSNKKLLPYQYRRITRVIIHELYNPRVFYENGIALLILKNPVNIQENTNIVCIPPENFNFYEHNQRCISTGWGTRSGRRNRQNSKFVKRIDVPLIPHQECENKIRRKSCRYFTLHSSLICAGGEIGKDICDRDGGSPLLCPMPNYENRYYQAGIDALSKGCKLKDVPKLYIDLTQFHDWINSKISSI